MNFITNKLFDKIGYISKKDEGMYYKYFICPECFKVTVVKGYFEYYINYKNFEKENVRVKLLYPDIQCYCDDCNEFMFDCDEQMVDSVVKFNKAGFTTEFCCHGHHADERASAIGCLYSIPYIRFADIYELREHDWNTICDTLNEAIIYTKWKEYFQINNLEKFLNNLKKVSPNESPIIIDNNNREICLNSKIFDNLYATSQEFDQIRHYFCSVINLVAYILSDEK